MMESRMKKTARQSDSSSSSVPMSAPSGGSRGIVDDFDDSLNIYLRQIGKMPQFSPEEMTAMASEIDAMNQQFRNRLLQVGFVASEFLRVINRCLEGENPADHFTPSSLKTEGFESAARLNSLKRWREDIDAALADLSKALNQRSAEREKSRSTLAETLARWEISGDYLEEFYAIMTEYLNIAGIPLDGQIEFFDTMDPQQLDLVCRKFTMTPDELSDYLAALKRDREQLMDIRNRMIEANLRLVISIAQRFRNRGMPFNDIIQEGNLGLLRALEKFDFKLGHKFSTYASWWIRQNIARAIAEQSRVIRIPAHMINTINAMNRAEQRFIQEHDRVPEVQELADLLEMPVARLSAIRKMAWQTISLQAPIAGNDDGSVLEDIIADDSDSGPVHDFARRVLYEKLYEMLGSLPERDQQIIILRFGLFGHKPLPLVDVSARFKLTRERIRQLEVQILENMRRLAQSTYLDGVVQTR